MKIFKNIILALWLLGIMALYFHLFWNAIFPYNEEEHRRAEIAKVQAEKRLEAIKQMQKTSMCEDDRFNHSDCE